MKVKMAEHNMMSHIQNFLKSRITIKTQWPKQTCDDDLRVLTYIYRYFVLSNKMKKKNPIVRTFSKSNRKIVKRGKIDRHTPNIQVQDRQTYP